MRVDRALRSAQPCTGRPWPGLLHHSPRSRRNLVKIAFILPLVLCAGLVIAGSVLAQRELALVQASAGSEQDVFNRFVDADLPAPGSISGTNRVIKRCAETTEGLYGALQPAQLTARARTHCLAFARRAVAAMPSNGFAYFLIAQSRFAEADMASANGALLRSYELAAHEQWLAEARVDLAEAHFQSLLPVVLEGHRSDLELLALSSRGVRSIAYRYVSDPGFRERITLIVETLPPEEQARFLSLVRRAATQYGFVGLVP